MRPIPITVLVCVALAAGLVPAPRAEAVVADRVAFVSDRGDSFDLWIHDGATDQQITNSPSNQELGAAWSPDASQLVYARLGAGERTSDLFVIDAAGATAPVRLTGDFSVAWELDPSWKPDGTRIAYTRTFPAQGVTGIYTIRADGDGVRRLTRQGHGRVDGSPAWSPTGASIAFSSTRKDLLADIWAMDADGSNKVRLTSTADADGNPTWSPDGTRIAFERCCPGGSSDIYVMDADGSDVAPVTQTTANEGEPSWSADGTRIVFTRYPAGGGNLDVWSAEPDGTNQQAVTASATIDMAPAAETLGGPTIPLAMPTPEPSAPESGTSAPTGMTSKRYETLRSRRLMAGVRFKRIVDHRGPNRIYLLRVDPTLKPTMDVALAQNQLPGFETTTKMARHHHALAAVNGDFGLPSGRPVHSFAEDGDLKQTAYEQTGTFSVAEDESEELLAPTVEHVWVTEQPSGDRWRAARWNRGQPAFGEVAVYSKPGGDLDRPPKGACAARLEPTSGRRFAPGDEGIERDFEVTQVRCARERMERKGGVVLAADPATTASLLVRSLSEGQDLTLTWSLHSEAGFWPRVADALGGAPMLLRGGNVVIGSCDAPVCARHPRTGVGLTADGRIVLVVVDGRRKRSVGLTLHGFARLMRRLGADDAVNLDGGGSSTMVVRGHVVNHPSDGHERAVSSALLVLSGTDTGEHVSAPVFLAPVSGPDPGLLAARDPASTGGLLDALARGLFGSPGAGPEARRVLEAFRAGYARSSLQK